MIDAKSEINRKFITYSLIALVLIVIKHLMVIRLPVEARHYSIDDLLMVQMAEGLLNGNWLGNYSPYILMKGCFFPILLAVINRVGIPYLCALDILNTAACIFFVWQMRYIVKNKASLLLLFTVLLFDPCLCAARTFQRVYRSSIVEMQTLFLFGSFFGLYFHIILSKPTDKYYHLKLMLYTLFNGFNLWAVWNTREESAWVLPFVSVASFIILFELLKNADNNHLSSKQVCKLVLITAVPFLILLAGNETVSLLNQHYYGENVRLEEADGNFADALKTIYSIKNESEIPYASVSREKVERLYEFSPSLASIRAELDNRLDDYIGAGRNKESNEIEDGWFFWALKSAPYINGAADTLPKSQEFWASVNDELNAAISDPANEIETINVMPSALMSPWRPQYSHELPKSFIQAVRYLVTYKAALPSIEPTGKASYPDTRRFELITNNLSMYSDDSFVNQTAAQKVLLTPVYKKLTIIHSVYHVINPVVAGLGVAAYLLVIILSIKNKEKNDIPFILVVLGMGASAVIMVIGSCYTHISAFTAITYYYLTGAYPLMLACEWISVLYVLQNIRRIDK